MAEANLALQLKQFDTSTDWKTIIIGNSRFVDDIWDLRPYMTALPIQEFRKYLRFDYIKSDSMKFTAKQYAYYKLGKIKPQTVVNIITGNLPSFFEFCLSQGIQSFSELSKEHFLNYNYWLKTEKGVAAGTGQKCAHIVEEIIKVGQIKGWDVPSKNILKGISSSQLWKAGSSYVCKTKPIPTPIFDKIMYHAVHGRNNTLTKAGIIIQSQTGLRINEVLSAQEGCVKNTSDGFDYMEVLISKTEKGEPVLHKVFINELVKSAIQELSDYTAELRKESGLKDLFLIRANGTIKKATTETWSSVRLRNFIERWDIRDNTGELYHLTSHQFRATFVRELVKQKVPLAMVMKQYGHVSIEMTAHYLTLQEEEVKEIYSDMILSPESKIAGLRAKEIKGKLDSLFHGKTREEIDDVISNLTKTMSFNPLPTGVCLYDFRRGNCTDGDGCFMYNCPNYITEVQFYPILKKELDLLEAEMARLKELGYERQWQVEYVKYKYLKPLVDDLEVQMNEESA